MVHIEDSRSLELQPLQISNEEDEAEGSNKYGGVQQGTRDEDEPPPWRQFFFPVSVPQELHLLRWENIGIPACYLLVGIMQGLFRVLLNVYPIDLSASEAQQTTLASIATIPAAFKLVFGFTSDNLPLFGLRRKPYMFLGWLTCSCTMAVLFHSTNLTLIRLENETLVPDDAPSIQQLGAAFFVFGTGMWLADVMADSLVAQKARMEPEERRGSMQSTCYASRFFGLMLAAPLSSYLYTQYDPVYIVRCLMMGPVLILPLVILLREDRVPIINTKQHINEIWENVCKRRSVWQPLGFVYLYNVLQVSNAAWKQFLRSVFGFTSADLNVLLVVSYVMLYLGSMAYKFCFLQTSWRKLYQLCITLNAFFSALQLLLIRGYTLGMSPFLFALGDDVFAEFLTGIQFLPVTIIMVALCLPGSEGASYAMFTTVWNSAYMLAPTLSSLLLGIFDVSKSTLEAGDVSGLFKLSVLTTAIQTVPILFIGLLPHARDDLMAMSDTKSTIGGVIFVALLFVSMIYTLVVAALNIFDPGWAGES